MADTSKRILYKQDDGIVAIIIPSPNESRTIEEIAAKDVPSGYKYKIVNTTDVPSDTLIQVLQQIFLQV